MTIAPRRLALGLAGFQTLDAVACAIPLAYIKADLDRLRCPRGLQRVLPVIKGLSAAGLLVGLGRPPLGRLTCTALVGYFASAIGFHVRAGDHPIRSVPAAALGTVAATCARTAYRS